MQEACTIFLSLPKETTVVLKDLRDLKIQRRRRQRERQQLCTCITLFCKFLCPFLYDCDVKMPNFAFYGGRKQATTKFRFSFRLGCGPKEIQLQEGSPTFDKVSGSE